MKFAKISENTFNELQTEAGILLNAFDPSNPAPPTTEQIICATTGGITATCVPTTRDDGEDVDNCPNNMLELKKIDSYEAKLAFTALSVTAETIRMSIGAADVEYSPAIFICHLVPGVGSRAGGKTAAFVQNGIRITLTVSYQILVFCHINTGT